MLPNGSEIVFLTVGGRTSAVVPSVQKKTGPVAGDVKPDTKGDEATEASATDGDMQVDAQEGAKQPPKGPARKERRRGGAKARRDAVGKRFQEDRSRKASARGAKGGVTKSTTNGAKEPRPKAAKKRATRLAAAMSMMNLEPESKSEPVKTEAASDPPVKAERSSEPTRGLTQTKKQKRAEAAAKRLMRQEKRAGKSDTKITKRKKKAVAPQSASPAGSRRSRRIKKEIAELAEPQLKVEDMVKDEPMT
jgi:hypothetical protein